MIPAACRDENLIYVCSPFRGNEALNMEAARRYCRYVVDQGKQPVAPHLLYPQFMTDETERDKTMEFSVRLLLMCGEIWAFGGSYVSEGMQIEIMTASKYRIPILFQQEGYEEWMKAEGESPRDSAPEHLHAPRQETPLPAPALVIATQKQFILGTNHPYGEQSR